MIRLRLVVLTLIATVFYIYSSLSWLALLVLIASAYLATGGWKFMAIFLRTLPRDAKSLIRFIRTKLYLFVQRKKDRTVPKVFQMVVRRHPDRVLFYHETRNWTFKEVDEFSNRVANCFLEMGFHPGEEVALFMESKPEYVGIWLGLAKAGIISALINTNQRLNTLVHSITVANCRALIFGNELCSAVRDVVPSLNQKGSMQYFCYGTYDPSAVPGKPLMELIQEASAEAPKTIARGHYTDKLFYIYTSGTTGLPKAAIIKHCRYLWMGAALKFMIGLRNDDTLYTCIPLYHLAGGVLGTCQCLIFGCSMAMRHKFSASNFWSDCIKYKATAAQYIGEICRYMLAQPPSPKDSSHCVRLMFGNGLRPSIWKEFQTRFKVKQIGEFYGSTEGNANIINVDNTEGSCGFISRIIPSIYPVGLVKMDEEKDEPVRGPDGLCMSCGPGEVGQFVGKIIKDSPERAFDGYLDEAANKRKVVRDVFQKGDAAFLSGDLLTMDKYGNLYFKDRTGDTFRWKGENVSTTEVEAVISNVLHFTDSIVYGVSVPGCEGKAGMAAIVDHQPGLNLEQFLKDLRLILPPFAIPAFLRVVKSIETTGTYKLPKNTYQSEGFNPDLVKDPLYYLDSQKRAYLPIDRGVYLSIVSGTLRV